MARRVGFNKTGDASPANVDDPGVHPSASEPRAPNLRFRHPVPRPVYKGQVRPLVWIILAVLGFWLAAWTLGIVLVLSGEFGDFGGTPFLYVWVGIAALGDGVAIFVLIKIIQGLRNAPEKPE